MPPADRVPWEEDDCLVIDRFHRIEANEVVHVGQAVKRLTAVSVSIVSINWLHVGERGRRFD